MDFNAPFGEDLALGGSSDVAFLGSREFDFNFVSGLDELTQRVVRRILTTKGEWVVFPDYGTYVRKYLHEPITKSAALDIRGQIKSQIAQEPDVATTPTPEVTFDIQPNGQFIVSIRFYTKDLQLISFAFKPRDIIDISLSGV
jgi:phage baseplate assembly protein W